MKFVLARRKDREHGLAAEVLGRIPFEWIHHEAFHRTVDVEGTTFGLSSELFGFEMADSHDVRRADSAKAASRMRRLR